METSPNYIYQSRIQRVYNYKAAANVKIVCRKGSHVVLPHGLDGLLNLSHLVVNHTVQLTVSHSITVHNDA